MSTATAPPVCAHCGTRTMVLEYNAEHMCLAFVFDWLEAASGLIEPLNLPGVVAFMDANGI